MKNIWILYSLIIITAVLMFKAKPIKKAMTRGYRNNNPGNIRLTSGQMWQGEIKGKDTAFKTFSNMAWGYRAVFVLLRTYINRGQNTIEKILKVYAPKSENDTDSYIRTVERISGLKRDYVLTFLRPDELVRVVKGISLVENGIEPVQDDIVAGYNIL